MPIHRCPGMNPNFWKPEDITEIQCKVCKEQIEFWKDDIKRECPKCKRVMVNPNLEKICMSWCDKAKECKEQGQVAQSGRGGAFKKH